MKKKLFCLALVLGIAVLLVFCFSCSTTHKMAMDENNPEANNVTITFHNETDNGWFILKKWNNVDIQEKLYGKKSISSEDDAVLTVPAGDNVFLFDVRYTLSYMLSDRYFTTTRENVELRYSLEEGKKYEVSGYSKTLGPFKGWELFIRIYDVTGKKSELLKEWKLGETK